AFTGLVDEIRKRGREAGESGGDVLPFAKALLLNGQSEDGIALAAKSNGNARMLYELLTARLKYREAFALVEEAREASRPDLPVLELMQARTLHYLGEKDRAKELVKKYAGQVAPGKKAGWFADLVEAELAVGGQDSAFALAGRVLSVTEDPSA